MHFYTVIEMKAKNENYKTCDPWNIYPWGILIWETLINWPVVLYTLAAPISITLYQVFVYNDRPES